MGGFFGTVQKQKCTADLFYGTDYQSHLGTKRGGMATLSDSGEFLRSIHNLENTYFRSRFEPELDKFQGKSGIGVISDTDAQPMLMNSHLGRFAIVTVAKITNQDDKDFVNGIEIVYKHIKGSCSMLLLTENGIIAARDSWGRTPIVVGKKDGALAVTSETSAFPNLGFETTYYVGPGEIIRITSDVMTVLRKPNPRMQICSFLWVYYGFPTSNYEGRNTEMVRNECGRVMGQEDKTEVDCACGIPDSGVGMAVGYAQGHGCPYMRAISKYTPTWPRSFTPSNQEMRNLVAKMKLIANKDVLEGKRVLFCDDSIVRGTQLRDNTKELHALGAKEVHMRIGCPPLVYSCPFVNYSASKSDLELLTRRIIKDFEGDDSKNLEAYTRTDSPEYKRMVDEIARRLNLDSLRFSKLETLVKAIGLPKERICTHCFDGSSFYSLEEENK